jgi:hypothetical protein
VVVWTGSVELGISKNFSKKKCFRYLTNSFQARLSRSDMPFEKREIFFIEMNSHILPKASSVFGLKPEI